MYGTVKLDYTSIMIVYFRNSNITNTRGIRIKSIYYRRNKYGALYMCICLGVYRVFRAIWRTTIYREVVGRHDIRVQIL